MEVVDAFKPLTRRSLAGRACATLSRKGRGDGVCGVLTDHPLPPWERVVLSGAKDRVRGRDRRRRKKMRIELGRDAVAD